MEKQIVSKQTQRIWWIDTGLFISAMIATLSGIYFLFLPDNGFQGGRNPNYGIMVFFQRHTWDDLHTWAGAVMIAATLIHLAFHWRWVSSMTRRICNELMGKCGCMNPHGRLNLILNISVAISFLLTAVSGVYFMFVHGGHRVNDPMILFNRTTWDQIHTWAGIMLIATAVIHFGIHWRWVANVTIKMAKILLSSRAALQPVTIKNQ
jgi:drug/metabolite transporter (DMT)-like permease